MKMNLKLTAIAATLLLVGCASDSDSTASQSIATNHADVTSQTASLGQNIKHLEENLSTAKQDELYWFATDTMHSAEQALKEAKEYYAVFENDPSKAHSSSGFFSSTTNLQAVEEAIKQFDIALNKARAIRTQSLTALDDAFSYRKQLQYIDAAKYYARTSKQLDSELKKLVNYIANGDIERATKAQPSLVSKQRALEVKTITRIYLSSAKKELARLKQANVSLHAPDTFAAAAATIPAAEAFITADPRAIAKIQDKADDAMFALHHAGHIADVVIKLKALPEQNYERHVLKFERMLLNISQALGAEDLRNKAISEQGKTLVSYIRQQQLDSTGNQQSLKQLLAQLETEQNKVSQLEQDIALLAAKNEKIVLLEAKIAQLSAEKLSTTADKTLPVTPVKPSQEQTAAGETTPASPAPIVAPEAPSTNHVEEASDINAPDVKATESSTDKTTG